MFQIDLRPTFGTELFQLFLGLQQMQQRREDLEQRKEDLALRKKQLELQLQEQQAATATAAAQLGPPASVLPPSVQQGAGVLAGLPDLPGLGIPRALGEALSGASAPDVAADPTVASLLQQVANAGAGPGAVAALPGAIARLQFDQPRTVGGLVSAGQAIGAPAAVTARQAKIQFPTQLEVAEDEVELTQNLRALALLSTPGLTAMDLADAATQDPTLFGALAKVGSSEPVRIILQERSNIKQAVIKAANAAGAEIVKDFGLTGTATAPQVGRIILGRAEPGDLSPEVLQAIQQQRTLMRAALIGKMQEAPSIRALAAFRAIAVEDGDEERLVALQDMINKETTRLFGPDAANLLPEFVRVPGRAGVTKGAKELSVITDPGDKLAVRFLFDENGGDLDAALDQINAALESDDPEAIAIAQMMLPLLQEFAANEKNWMRFKRGIARILGRPQPRIER